MQARACCEAYPMEVLRDGAVVGLTSMGGFVDESGSLQTGRKYWYSVRPAGGRDGSGDMCEVATEVHVEKDLRWIALLVLLLGLAGYVLASRCGSQAESMCRRLSRACGKRRGWTRVGHSESLASSEGAVEVWTGSLSTRVSESSSVGSW